MIVPITQILVILSSHRSSFCRRPNRSVPCSLLLPCLLLLLASVPIGLYNVTLWKDVPFALLVVFWGIVLVYFYDRTRAGASGPRGGLNIGTAVLLLLSFTALLTIRYNGLVYLLIVPLLLRSLSFWPFRSGAFWLSPWQQGRWLSTWSSTPRVFSTETPISVTSAGRISADSWMIRFPPGLQNQQ